MNREYDGVVDLKRRKCDHDEYDGRALQASGGADIHRRMYQRVSPGRYAVAGDTEDRRGALTGEGHLGDRACGQSAVCSGCLEGGFVGPPLEMEPETVGCGREERYDGCCRERQEQVPIVTVAGARRLQQPA